jgi:hypothetical protein
VTSRWPRRVARACFDGSDDDDNGFIDCAETACEDSAPGPEGR